MSETKRRAIIVLGMHRSGTSALAGVLGLLGARLPARLMPTRPDNPKGHFEPGHIVAIHDRILASAGTTWSGWEEIPEAWFLSEPSQAFVDELVEAISEDYGAAALFMVKDPRMCRLMPLWYRVLDRIDVKPCFAIPLRDPVEVARSLQNRDNLPLAHGCLLWLRHVLDAERHTRGHPRVFLRYRDLLDGPRSVIDRMTTGLGVAWPRQVENSLGEIEGFLDPSLRTQIAHDGDIDEMGDFSPWLRQAYECYEALVRSPTDRAARRRLDSLQAAFAAADAAFTPVFKHQAEQHGTELAALRETLAARQMELTTLGRALAERDTRLAALDQALAEREAKVAALDQTLAERERELGGLRVEITGLSHSISEIHSSHSWQITKPMRFVGRQIRRGRRFIHILSAAFAKGGGIIGTALAARRVMRREGLVGLQRAFLRIRGETLIGVATSAPGDANRRIYREWVKQYDTLNDDDRKKIHKHIMAMRHKPLISVVMPVYNPFPRYLDDAIQSVRGQLYPHWELCIADDASTDGEIQRVIGRHAESDSRIKVVYRKTNGHICHATNSALELAQGDFIALLDHDDIITEHALYWVAAELEKHPNTDILYSDSDLIGDSGERFSPYFKTDFNLELMLGHNMVSHFGVYKRSLVEAAGGMRAGLEGSQDYDLLLRVFAKSTTERIRHIPTVLYHWRRSDHAPSFSMKDLDRCVQAARKAVDEFLHSKGIAADVLPAPQAPYFQRIRYHLPNPAPKVSVIIPTRNQAKLIERCVQGVLTKTDYPSLDVTIVDNDSDDAETMTLFAELAKHPLVRVVCYPGAFNFAAINNFAVGQTDGAILAFLNNDIEITQPDWLREMVSHAAQPDVGAVGAKLCYPNGTIQHAGIVTGMGSDRIAGHLYFQAPPDYIGPFGQLLLAREVSAVTCACMIVRRNVFLEVGGLDEAHLAVAYNDVDFCLRLHARGYRNIITPFAELIHHESATRGSDHLPAKRERFLEEVGYMKQRWGDLLLNDPFFSPNLSLDFPLPELARPPRVNRPWEKMTCPAK
jgi:glycosyltransferase involved in cell wall biosynthesis